MKHIIRYEETFAGFFEVEAESKDQALELFYQGILDGCVDYDELEIVHSKAEVSDEPFIDTGVAIGQTGKMDQGDTDMPIPTGVRFYPVIRYRALITIEYLDNYDRGNGYLTYEEADAMLDRVDTDDSDYAVYYHDGESWCITMDGKFGSRVKR